MSKTTKPLLDYIPDDDGYTETAFLSGIPRIHGDVTIVFRPTPVSVRLPVQEAIQKVGEDAEKAERIQSLAVVERIVSWSILGKDGEKLPVNADNLLRLKTPLYNRVNRVVFYGTDGGDVQPDSKQGNKPSSGESAEDIFKSLKAKTGRPETTSKVLEDSQKN